MHFPQEDSSSEIAEATARFASRAISLSGILMPAVVVDVFELHL
jgi:hypothetical protein